jgi:hypothetical protein
MKIRGLVPQDHIRGLSMKREYVNTTQKSIQYHNYEVKVKLLNISAMY